MRKSIESAIDAGHTKYTPALGLPQLRQAIAQSYQQQFGLHYECTNVGVTLGVSGALQLALAAITDAGDSIACLDPGYPCYAQTATVLGVHTSRVAVDASRNYVPTVDEVAAVWNDRCRALVVSSPGNPTGAVIPLEELRHLHEWVRAQGAWLIVDEIYLDYHFCAKPITAASICPNLEQLIIFNGFSKYYGLSGWRLGWMLAPESLLEAVERMAQNIFLAPPTAVQYAAIDLLAGNDVELLQLRKQDLLVRRDFLVDGLRALGFIVAQPPAGGLYVYADISAFELSSMTFCERLLEEQGVAATPGHDFGEFQAEQHVRFTFTNDVETLAEALRRIADFMQTL